MINFTRPLNPTLFDIENGLDNVYFERSEGKLPRELFISAKVSADADVSIISIKDADGNDVARELLSIADDCGTSLRGAICADALRIAGFNA